MGFFHDDDIINYVLNLLFKGDLTPFASWGIIIIITLLLLYYYYSVLLVFYYVPVWHGRRAICCCLFMYVFFCVSTSVQYRLR